MDFALSEEQTAIFDMARAFGQEHIAPFARRWDPVFAGPAAGSTVIDLHVPSRDAVDEAHDRVVAAGFASSVEPWDTFFGSRYAIVCDHDGHRVGLKSPQDPELGYPLD